MLLLLKLLILPTLAFFVITKIDISNLTRKTLKVMRTIRNNLQWYQCESLGKVTF